MIIIIRNLEINWRDLEMNKKSIHRNMNFITNYEIHKLKNKMGKLNDITKSFNKELIYMKERNMNLILLISGNYNTNKNELAQAIAFKRSEEKINFSLLNGM